MPSTRREPRRTGDLWEADVLSVREPYRVLTPERRLLWALLEDAKRVLAGGCQPRRYRVEHVTHWHCPWHDARAWLAGHDATIRFALVCQFLGLDETMTRGALLSQAPDIPPDVCVPLPHRLRQSTARRRLLVRTGKLQVVAWRE